MTTPEVAKDLFKEAQAAFTPIVGAPNDDDVKRLTLAFINMSPAAPSTSPTSFYQTPIMKTDKASARPLRE